jgi:dTDP-4-dehydrorhamnose reductase
MKLLITGASGAVGRPLVKRFAEAGHELVLVDLLASCEGVTLLDLTDYEAVARLMSASRPDAVLHLAGVKNVVECERRPDFSYRQNVQVSCRLYDLCCEHRAQFVFISSDYVFLGSGGPFSERAEPHPTTVYGQHKLAVENYLKETQGSYAIVRTAGLFGYPADFVHVVRAALSAGQSFKAFTDLVNTPTWIGDFFEMVSPVLNKKLRGLFHMAGCESVSRYAYAVKIAQTMGFDPGSILPEKTPENDARPKNSSLDSRESYERLGYSATPLDVCLRFCLSE